jgi:hypothetical protein
MLDDVYSVNVGLQPLKGNVFMPLHGVSIDKAPPILIALKRVDEGDVQVREFVKQPHGVVGFPYAYLDSRDRSVGGDVLVHG